MQDLGSSEIFPATLKHNSNGRFVAVCGDGEFVIYTALAWRNKAFGRAADFVWAAEANDYAVRETKPDTIKVFKNFKARPPPCALFLPCTCPPYQVRRFAVHAPSCACHRQGAPCFRWVCVSVCLFLSERAPPCWRPARCRCTSRLRACTAARCSASVAPTSF